MLSLKDIHKTMASSFDEEEAENITFVMVPQNVLASLLERLDRMEAILENPKVSREDYLTIEETMTVLSVSRKTLQTYRDKRAIGFVQVGRRVWFPWSEIRNFMNRNHIKPREQTDTTFVESSERHRRRTNEDRIQTTPAETFSVVRMLEFQVPIIPDSLGAYD